MLEAPELVQATAQIVTVIRLTISRDQIQEVMGPAIMDDIEAAGHKPAANLWERYLSRPERYPDPATYRTELNRPIL